jgi:hypothetical protein
MLTTYIKHQTTQATYYAGPAGPYLDEFTDWLAQRAATDMTRYVIACQARLSWPPGLRARAVVYGRYRPARWMISAAICQSAVNCYSPEASVPYVGTVPARRR